MPIYEYRCESCGHELEAIQKFDDPALTDCPACGKAQLKKLVSAAGFQLKGTGWYVTDFKDGGKKKKQEKTAGSESSTESKPKQKEKAASSSSGNDD
ncbi:MAG: FmdB family zinc ribbon protein [Acidiferrobacterales bacterium]